MYALPHDSVLSVSGSVQEGDRNLTRMRTDSYEKILPSKSEIRRGRPVSGSELRLPYNAAEAGISKAHELADFSNARYCAEVLEIRQGTI